MYLLKISSIQFLWYIRKISSANDLHNTRTTLPPQNTCVKNPACNYILDWNWIQETEAESLIDACKCQESSTRSTEAPAATGLWKLTLFSGSLHFPACLEGYIQFWQLQNKAWPLLSLYLKSCIFLSTLRGSSSGSGDTALPMSTMEGTQYVRSARDNSL